MNNQSSDWPAPAKINRFLHVLRQRSDGYHDLQTLFQFVAPCDRLDFQITSDGMIQREGGLPGLSAEADLVVRAASALQQSAGIRQGARITIDKHIPAGGGLGGGSSDAATTLVALNHLWGCHWSQAALIRLGLSLGADVPVFITGKAAWAEGVGEQLSPVMVDCPWLVLLDPGVSVETASVFQHPKLTRHSPHTTIRGFSAETTRNDCESVVRRLHPAVSEALDALAAFGPARLTGTGGCMFATFDSRGQAEQVAAEVADHGQVWVCQASNRSPLLTRLEAEGH